MKSHALFALGLGASLLAAAGVAHAQDAAAGASVFNKKCKACHTIEEGKHRTGPSLYHIYGRQAGSTDFKRYRGLTEADWAWDTETLTEYLKDPKAFVQARGAKTTGMTFRLKDDTEIADVIAYLQEEASQ